MDVKILIPVKIRRIAFTGYGEEVDKAQPIRGQGGNLGFLIGLQTTNLVENVEFLLSVKFCSAVSEKKSKMWNANDDGRRTTENTWSQKCTLAFGVLLALYRLHGTDNLGTIIYPLIPKYNFKVKNSMHLSICITWVVAFISDPAWSKRLTTASFPPFAALCNAVSPSWNRNHTFHMATIALPVL